MPKFKVNQTINTHYSPELLPGRILKVISEPTMYTIRWADGSTGDYSTVFIDSCFSLAWAADSDALTALYDEETSKEFRSLTLSLWSRVRSFMDRLRGK